MARVALAYAKRHHLALIALFIALGGTSYAAINLPRNSVGTKQLRNNAVNSQKVKNRSLRARDFARRQLPRGPAGPAGPAGQAGQPGPQGSPAGSIVLGRIPSDVLDTLGDDDYPPFGDVRSEGYGESPNAPVLLRDLSVEVDVGSGASTARSWHLGIAAASGHPTPALTCQMVGADTTCDSGDQTALVPAGSRLVLRQSVNGQVNPSEARFGYRALTP